MPRTGCDLVYWVIFSLPCPDEELGSDGAAWLGTRHPGGGPATLGPNFLVAKCLSGGNYKEWVASCRILFRIPSRVSLQFIAA